MTLLAPLYFLAALAVAAGVVALHFIVTREPRTVPLPTARFVPDRAVRAQSRAVQLQDLLLLAMRVVLVLAAGLALAQPLLTPSRRATARIVIADRSRAVASMSSVADSARALLREGDALIVFDSAAAVITDGAADSLASSSRAEARGRLSVALIAALRTASLLRDRADSIELVVVSPLVEEELDAATDSIRALWRGSIRLISVEPSAAVRDPIVGLVARADDPIRFALPAGGPDSAEAPVRLVRSTLGAADSAWVRAGNRALVHWPDALSPGGGSLESRARPDTVGAVIAGDAVVVALFMRARRFGNAADGLRTSDLAPGVLRPAVWLDGEPAAIEERIGNGCIRTVDIPVPGRGDLVLHPRFAALVRALTGPCGGRPRLDPVSSSRRAALAGAGSVVRVARSDIAPSITTASPLSRWLLLFALLLAAGELLVRRRITRAAGTPA